MVRRHPHLSHLRDRLTVARDLLADSGSIFVQIGDDLKEKLIKRGIPADQITGKLSAPRSKCLVDERVASPGLHTHPFALPGTVTNGLFTLSFRLDAFNKPPNRSYSRESRRQQT